MTTQETTTTLELPNRIVTRVRDRLPRTEFNSEAEYISYVMEEVLYHVEAQTEDEDAPLVDEAEVEQRLKSLAYLNE